MAVVNSRTAGLRAWPDSREVGREPKAGFWWYGRMRGRLSKYGCSRSPGPKASREQAGRRVSLGNRDVGGGLGGVVKTSRAHIVTRVPSCCQLPK